VLVSLGLREPTHDLGVVDINTSNRRHRTGFATQVLPVANCQLTSSTATMRYVLFSLSAFVFYTIFYFSYTNGLDALGHKAIDSGKLPGVNAPLRTLYTGVEPIDRILTLLTVFFYPSLDGQSPTLLLHSIGFSGTFGAAWTLVVLESWRKGNAGTIVAL
jgi:hypothetical protein